MASPTSLQTTQVYPNPFDLLPEEVILDNIVARHLDQNDILSIRLVNRRFSILFGEDRFWRLYYRNLGLEPPELARSEATLSKLAVKLPFWMTLKGTIEKLKLSAITQNKDKWYCTRVRTLCLVALATPELTTLHPYCFSILKEYYEIPESLTKEDIFLYILQRDIKDNNFSFYGYEFAVKRLSHRSKEPIVQETFLDWVNSGNFNFTKTCSLALKKLSPYLSEKKKEDIAIFAIKEFHCDGFSVVKAVLKQFMTPNILNLLCENYHRKNFSEILRNNLNINFINELVKKLNEPNNEHIFKVILKALKPVANHELVQKAYCQLLGDLTLSRSKATMLMNSMSMVQLTETIKEEFHDVPFVKTIIRADRVFQLSFKDVNQRQELISLLFTEQSFKRLNAAKQLAPFIDDPEVLAAFKKCLKNEEYELAEVVMMQSLANISSSMRIKLLNKSAHILSSRLHSKENSQIQLEIIKIFCSFIDEYKIRSNLFSAFRLSVKPTKKIQMTLINAFATQLHQEDVRTFLLETLHLYFSSLHEGSKIALIEKLVVIADLPMVKSNLIKLFQEYDPKIRAASMRALCPYQKKPLIPLESIFLECLNGHYICSKEALRIIKRLAHDQTN